MRKIHFMSAALMAILVTSMGGLQNASALFGTDQIPADGVLDFYELKDGSGSITQTIFDNTIIPANQAAFAAALTNEQFGKVRVTVIQFSEPGLTTVECQQMINSAADVTALIACVGNIVYQNGGSTCISCAYDLVTTELGTSPIDGVNDRSIVDLVTDGNHNEPNTDLPASFAAALAAGLDSSVVLGVGGAVTIPSLQALVHPNPPGPLFDPLMQGDVLPDPLDQGFVIIIAGFSDFADALEQKFAVIVIDVGGEYLDINSAALLLAGAQTNAVWIMSALAAIGSVAFGALYIKSRKH